MENWVTIRKGSAHIYVEYDHTHTGNLSADNIRIRVAEVVKHFETVPFGN